MATLRVWCVRGAVVAIMLQAAVYAADSAAPGWRPGRDNDTLTGAPTLFSTRDGVILANGKPFLLNLDFTWSASTDDAFYHYWSRLGGTAHHLPSTALAAAESGDFRALDAAMEAVARRGLYVVLDPSIVGGFAGTYLRDHPEARMLDAAGAVIERNYPSFVDPGYRAALAKALGAVAAHLKDKPYVLGYYLNDEFSFPGWGGYEPVSVALFRQRLLAKCGSLEKLNAAWKTAFAAPEAIVPPAKPEPGRRWADWQRFRQWTYFDFMKAAAEAIRAQAPHQLVINSMDFWGLDPNPTNWWTAPQCVDVLMRHGIGYTLGYNFLLIRDIAEWSGKPGQALCMPPGYSASFIHFMQMFDSSRTGLSYVCPGGSVGAAQYRGAADSDDGYRRREPGYTTAAALIQLQHVLGDTYLLSKRYPPTVGFLVTDATFVINPSYGAASGVAGICELLTDLNVDFRIVSEHNARPLSQFKALIVGPAAALAADDLVADLRAFQADGGALIVMPGAFERNDVNEPAAAGRLPALQRFQAVEPGASLRLGDQPLALGPRATVCPVTTAAGDQAVAWLPGKDAQSVGSPAALITDGGRTLLLGWDVGNPYLKSWTETLEAGTAAAEDKSTVMEQAYGSDRKKGDLEKEDANALRQRQAQLRLAGIVRDFLAARGAVPSVSVAGREAPASVYARAFTSGDAVLVTLANRAVKPGAKRQVWDWDIDRTGEGQWPADYHIVLPEAKVRVALPPGAPDRLRAYRLPNLRRQGTGTVAFPAEVAVSIAGSGAVRTAEFVLPDLENWDMVLLAAEYRPLLGLALDQRTVLPGETVHATARLLNAGAGKLAGTIGIEDRDMLLDVPPPAWQAAVEGGAAADRAFALVVPVDARPGYYSFRAVQRLVDGTEARSASVELRVQAPYQASLRTDQVTSFWTDGSAPVHVELKVALPRPGLTAELAAELAGGAKFAATPARQEWSGGTGETEHTFAFEVSGPAEGNAVETGAVRLRGQVVRDGTRITVAQDFTVRFAKGVVVYDDRQRCRPLNSSEETEDMKLICLENERLTARFYADRGAVLHNLIVRATGQELLSPDQYPFGLVWYAWAGGPWSCSERLSEADRAGARFVSTSPGGKPVNLTVWLRRGEPWLDLVFDASQSEPLPERCSTFYLMSRIGREGNFKQNSVWLPLTGGMKERKRGSPRLEVGPGEFAEPWAAVADSLTGHVLATFFDIPALAKVTILDAEAFNYELFRLDTTKSPGVIRFRLCADQGGLEKVPDWQAAWNRR